MILEHIGIIDFLKHTRERDADGAIPYKGFHPHMLGTTNYAFMKHDKQWMLQIKEKSLLLTTGCKKCIKRNYYFKKGAFVKYFKKLIDRDINKW